MKMAINISLKTIDHSNIEQAYALLLGLRRDLSMDRFSNILFRNEYEFKLIYAKNTTTEIMVGVIGYRVLETITRSTHMHIHDLVIAKQYQRHGYGTLALNILFDMCKAQGFSWMFLDSVPSAIPFYSKIGFIDHSAKLMKFKIS
jgi:GNAT superfamily N-acetyltransferase